VRGERGAGRGKGGGGKSGFRVGNVEAEQWRRVVQGGTKRAAHV
jgi:hypothetical protein